MSVRSMLLSLCGGCGMLLVVLAALAGGVAYATSTPTVPACSDGGGIPPPGAASATVGPPPTPPVLIYTCGNALNRTADGICESAVGGQFCDSAFTAPPSPCKCATVDVSGCECRR